MAAKVVFPLFWGLGVILVGLALQAGGWALVVPAAVLAAAGLFALDLLHHREIVTFDSDLGRAAANVLAAAALAASSMYWLGLVLFKP